MDLSKETVPLIMGGEPTALAEGAKEKLQGQGKEALKDIAFGSIAGIAGKFVEYPFDTIKVRLQSQPEGRPLIYEGPLDCFKQSLRKDGFLGLYRGISAPLFGAAVETSSLFFSYRIAQDALQSSIYPATQPLPLSALIFCGAGSGAFTSLLLTPIELVKCKMQVPVQATAGSGLRAPGILSIMASIYRHQGIRGFWHGQLGTLIRETGGSAAWFGGYEGTSLFFRRLRHRNAQKTAAATDGGPTTAESDELAVWQQMAAGAAAGMSYNFLFYPADTIKSRMQTMDVTAVGVRHTFGSVGRAIWREHGLKGLYRGCGITVGRSVPSSAFIFTIYEQLRKTFG